MSELQEKIAKRRTFAIISHPDAGKTTLTEKLLLYGGAIHLAGSVKSRKANKHAVSDWMEIEKQRGISVTSSVLQFDYDGYRVNILDTPGHQDFSEDTYRTLIAADSAPDGTDGFPGNLELEIQYKLVRSGLMIRYSASTDAPTVCNLTNHSYFNLNGHASGTALGHRISVDADAYLETDDTSVPTGRKIPVAGTPMDFTEEKTLGLDIEADYPALKQALGYDHCYIIRDTGLRHAAWATGPLTGIRMEVLTTLPGMHLYSANYLEPLTDCKDGAHYQKRDAICFETEEFPDAPNHPEFPDTSVLPNTPYSSTTIYRFDLAPQ